MMNKLRETVGGRKKVDGLGLFLLLSKTDVEHLCLKAFWSERARWLEIVQFCRCYKYNNESILCSLKGMRNENEGLQGTLLDDYIFQLKVALLSSF